MTSALVNKPPGVAAPVVLLLDEEAGPEVPAELAQLPATAKSVLQTAAEAVGRLPWWAVVLGLLYLARRR